MCCSKYYLNISFLFLTNISVTLHNFQQYMSLKHFTKSLHTQQKLQTNLMSRQNENVKMTLSKKHLENKPKL